MPKEGETISVVEPSGSANIVSAWKSIKIRPTGDNTEMGDVNKNDTEYTQTGRIGYLKTHNCTSRIDRKTELRQWIKVSYVVEGINIYCGL